jgi:hypothetical protein
LNVPNLTEDVFANLCGAKPNVGIENPTLHEIAEKFLPVRSCGSDVWRGGLAIFNIREPLSSIGHYVVVLGMRGGKVRYYCPFHATVLEMYLTEIDWRSGDGKYVNWSLNFEAQQDFYETAITSEAGMGVAAGEPNPEYLLDMARLFLARHQPRGCV